MTLLTPTDPASGEPLTADTPYSLAGGGDRWPVVVGIPYLRGGRDDLRREALRRLDAGDADGGLAVLLTDQDSFAPLSPPAVEECRTLVADVRAGRCGLKEAMRRLNFGPVADYFAVRVCTPTFLSGLGLLSQCGGGLPVVEVACGIGQLLRELSRRGVPCAGVDLVFSKLWLARTFIVSAGVPLVCADLVGRAVEPATAVTVLCHDAFYFIPDKAAGAAALKRLAGAGGRVLVGHCHVAGGANGGVAGDLLTAAGYAELFPGCAMFDDAAFTGACLSGKWVEEDRPAALTGIEAAALMWPEGGYDGEDIPDTYADPAEGTPLVVNPLLDAVGGLLSPLWPSPRFAAEYATADYLSGDPPAEAAAALQADPADEPAWSRREDLARRRVLVPAGDVL